MGCSLILLILCGLLAAGVITRVQFLDRSLWLDEARVANSIGASAYTKRSITMTGCRRTHLFIALSRLVTAAFGTSYLAFQPLSVLSGLVSVLLFFLHGSTDFSLAGVFTIGSCSLYF